MGFKILNFIFIYLFFFFGGGGVQKNEYFFGYEDFEDIFGGHHKIGLYLGVISMHLSVFSKCQVTEWETFFGVAKNKKIKDF